MRMSRLGLAAIAMALAVFTGSAAVAVSYADFSWRWEHTYPAYDLTVDAVLNGGSDFTTWRSGFAPVYSAMVEAPPMSAPGAAIVMPGTAVDNFTAQEVKFPFPSGPTIGTILLTPNVIDPAKPVIIAIHGHEMAERGTTPWSMLNTGEWAREWAKAGYVVWIPSHLWYATLGSYNTSLGYSYPMIWQRMLNRLLDAAIPLFPAHNGMVATGLSTGASSASFMMAYRSDIQRGVFAGSLFSLDFARENFRALNVPNSWDIKSLFSYVPIYALIAPRPAQWQMGRADIGLFPRVTQPTGDGVSYPAPPRPPIVHDMVGEWLVMQKIWTNAGGAASLHIHNGGHVYDFAAAKAFIEAP